MSHFASAPRPATAPLAVIASRPATAPRRALVAGAPGPAATLRRAVAAVVLVLVALVGLPATAARAAWSGDPTDVRPGTPDAVLTGKLVVRDGGSVEGGTVTVLRLDSPDGIFWGLDATADATGAWRLDVPAGRYELQAQSRFGATTNFPDLSPALGQRPVVVARGQTLEHLDFSLRRRLPQAADDEYGWLQGGWDDARYGSVKNPVPWPRDTYRSITAVRGPVPEVDGPRPQSAMTQRFATTSEFRYAPGTEAVPFEYDLTNTGDGVLWTDDVHVDGAPGEMTTCGLGSFLRCSGTWLAPGMTITFPVTVDVRARTGPFVATVVIPNNAGADVRIPVRLVPTEANAPAGTGARSATAPVFGKVPVAAAAAPAPDAAASWAAMLRAVDVRRASVRLRFPAAGRVVVRIDRPVRSGPRGAVRWRTARTVRLRASRAGSRVARMARLATGRYRVRVEATAAAGGRSRVSAVRTVRR